jgi:hypothetical protein
VPAVPFTGTVPNVVPFDENVTVPAGAAPTLSAEIVRLSVSWVPTSGAYGEAVMPDIDVTAFCTVKLTAELVLALKLASPGNAAVRLSLPTGSNAVWNSATPALLNCAVPSVAVPLLKVIVPVAAPSGFDRDELFP